MVLNAGSVTVSFLEQSWASTKLRARPPRGSGTETRDWDQENFLGAPETPKDRKDVLLTAADFFQTPDS
jgi:hypothetical protein